MKGNLGEKASEGERKENGSDEGKEELIERVEKVWMVRG